MAIEPMGGKPKPVSAMALSPSPPKGKLATRVGIGAAALMVALVATFEGKRNDPYKDKLAYNILTVCYGETRVAMRHYTDAECKAMLADGLDDFAGPVLARNPELKGHDPQLAAAVSLAYNIGTGAYRKSSVARNFSAGNWRGACDAFLKWSYAGGKQVKGLLRRRQEERALCLRGVK